jgi:hypothetical protein
METGRAEPAQARTDLTTLIRQIHLTINRANHSAAFSNSAYVLPLSVKSAEGSDERKAFVRKLTDAAPRA